jgi:ammonia channel protein AmtB
LDAPRRFKCSSFALASPSFTPLTRFFIVFGWLGAEDVGGRRKHDHSHVCFGAYFGLTCSHVMNRTAFRTHTQVPTPDRVSDVLALIGTTVLWIFWPSFVGAAETGTPLNEMRCVINTICALLASTSVSFYLSHKLNHFKFDARTSSIVTDKL